MKKILNKITRFIYGVDCYPEYSNTEYTPTFRTVYPEGYDPNNTAQFNLWAYGINSSIK